MTSYLAFNHNDGNKPTGSTQDQAPGGKAIVPGPAPGWVNVSGKARRVAQFVIDKHPEKR